MSSTKCNLDINCYNNLSVVSTDLQWEIMTINQLLMYQPLSTEWRITVIKLHILSLMMISDVVMAFLAVESPNCNSRKIV